MIIRKFVGAAFLAASVPWSSSALAFPLTQEFQPNGPNERTTRLVSETVIGRWCDVMVPGNQRFRREIKIVVSDSGTVAETKFFDGSKRSLKLRELSGGVFAVVGSGSGDAFRISGGSGELQLFDRDGYIRSARRLENNSAGGDCIR